MVAKIVLKIYRNLQHHSMQKNAALDRNVTTYNPILCSSYTVTCPSILRPRYHAAKGPAHFFFVFVFFFCFRFFFFFFFFFFFPNSFYHEITFKCSFYNCF